MCEYENKLVAWIDGELGADESGALDRHVRMCASCSSRANAYREISQSFAEYVWATPIRSKTPHVRAKVLGAVAIAGAAAAIIVLALRPAPASLPVERPVAAEPAVAVATPQPPPAPVAPVRHKRPVRSQRQPVAPWIGSEPTIRIALPADAMFAPGAMPSGFTFAADLTVSGDGTPETLRVRPGIFLK